jgi:hypothetical protein
VGRAEGAPRGPERIASSDDAKESSKDAMMILYLRHTRLPTEGHVISHVTWLCSDWRRGRGARYSNVILTLLLQVNTGLKRPIATAITGGSSYVEMDLLLMKNDMVRTK